MKDEARVAMEAEASRIAYETLVKPIVAAMMGTGTVQCPGYPPIVHRIQWDGNYRTFTVGVEAFQDDPYDLGGVEEAIRQLRYGRSFAANPLVIQAYIEGFKGVKVQSVGVTNAMTLAHILFNQRSLIGVHKNRETGEFFYCVPFDLVRNVGTAVPYNDVLYGTCGEFTSVGG